MPVHPSILFVLPLPPPTHGAAYMGSLIRDSEYVNTSFVCSFVNLSLSTSVSEIGSFSFRKIFSYASLWFKLLGKLVSHRYDACYIAPTCHGYGFLKDFPYIILCRMFCRKIVIHQHNKGMSSCAGRLPYRWFLPLAYRNARVMLLSWRLYDDVSMVVKRDQVCIVANGIGTFTGEIPDPHETGPARILFLSNLLPSKGVYTLLEALSALKARGVDFECTIAGNETVEINAEKLSATIAELGLEKVSYIGPVYGDAAKAELFSRSDVFAFPSTNEAFPLVLLEAMQSGIPCVVFDEGGVPDIVKDGENGFVVRKNDADAFACALEKLACDSGLRRSMGETGRKMFAESFTADAFEHRFVDEMKLFLKS